MDADEIISKLNLQPHPEGGYYAETFRDPREASGRSVGSAIFFLLKAGEVSRWHVVDATEIWHYYAGSPLKLGIAAPDGPKEMQILGADLAAGQLPQRVVPAGYWQQAESGGEWTLVGCTVSPGFEFDGFTMADEGWEPPSS